MNLPKILSETPHYVGLCDQLNGRVIIRDLGNPDWNDKTSILWEYRHDTQGHENYGWIAGLKFRRSDYYGEDVALISGQPRKAYIISMKTKKILLTANEAGCNPHTSELLPDGTLIVGSSNDGRVSIYPPGKSEAAYTLQLAGDDRGVPDVHGILWDPKYNLLWVEGGQKLRSFRVEGSETSPSLTPVGEYTAPKGGMHDMAPFYGDPDSLLISAIGGIVRFHKKTETFSYDYPCKDAAATDLGCCTGFGLFADGVLPIIAAGKSGGVYQYWNADTIFICVTDEKETKVLTHKVADDAYYKLRIFDTRYQ
ncbi:MAG: hypothetical protein J6C26_03565 [Clostridia bacterium]|nr:hypothetical protein [Clostridia bacterium]